MDKLSQSKNLRIWTYIIAFMAILMILSWQCASILNAIANILTVISY